MKSLIITDNKEFESKIRKSLVKEGKVEKVVKNLKYIESYNNLYSPNIIIIDIKKLSKENKLLIELPQSLKEKIIILEGSILENMGVSKKGLNGYELSKFLIELGMHPKFKGFEYIKRSINHLEDPEICMNDLYNALANEFGRTPKSVERAIRTCIKDVSEFQTNKEIISYVYEKFK